MGGRRGNRPADTVTEALGRAPPRQVAAGVGGLRAIAFSGPGAETHPAGSGVGATRGAAYSAADAAGTAGGVARWRRGTRPASPRHTT